MGIWAYGHISRIVSIKSYVSRQSFDVAYGHMAHGHVRKLTWILSRRAEEVGGFMITSCIVSKHSRTESMMDPGSAKIAAAHNPRRFFLVLGAHTCKLATLVLFNRTEAVEQSPPRNNPPIMMLVFCFCALCAAMVVGPFLFDTHESVEWRYPIMSLHNPMWNVRIDVAWIHKLTKKSLNQSTNQLIHN